LIWQENLGGARNAGSFGPSRMTNYVVSNEARNSSAFDRVGNRPTSS
jgi:hypothetical protein